MRVEGMPMTAADFEDALASARRGIFKSDTGATDAVEAALDRVARRTPGAIAEARAAFSASTSTDPEITR